MTLYEDLNNGNVNEEDQNATHTTGIELKRGNVPISIIFRRGQIPRALLSTAEIKFVVKELGKYDSAPIAQVVGFVPPSSIELPYTATLSTDTDEVRTLMFVNGSPSDDVASISAMAEILYRNTSTDDWIPSKTIAVTLTNRVSADDDSGFSNPAAPVIQTVANATERKAIPGIHPIALVKQSDISNIIWILIANDVTADASWLPVPYGDNDGVINGVFKPRRFTAAELIAMSLYKGELATVSDTDDVAFGNEGESLGGYLFQRKIRFAVRTADLSRVTTTTAADPVLSLSGRMVVGARYLVEMFLRFVDDSGSGVNFKIKIPGWAAGTIYAYSAYDTSGGAINPKVAYDLGADITPTEFGGSVDSGQDNCVVYARGIVVVPASAKIEVFWSRSVSLPDDDFRLRANSFLTAQPAPVAP